MGIIEVSRFPAACQPSSRTGASEPTINTIDRSRPSWVWWCGVVLAGIAWRARLDRAALQAFAVAGMAGFGTAILVHPAIGYNDLWHLIPALGGATVFACGWWLLRARTID